MLFRFDPFDQQHRAERAPGLLAMDAVHSDDTTLVNQRPQGTFRRHIQFGDTIDVDAIEAELANGVLRLTLPVKEGAKARSIEITTGDSSGRPLEATATG